MRKILLASVAALGVTAAASAQDGGGYVGAGYTALDGDGATLGAITLRGGYNFSKYFGIEGDAHIGVVDDTIDVLGTDVDISADFGFAGYGVARLPVGENNSNVFVRAGYGTLSLDASGGGASVSEDVDGFAYGVGGEFFFDAANGVRFDYTIFDSDDGGDLDTYGIHYIRRF
jgi:outer membrane immunogenic protein